MNFLGKVWVAGKQIAVTLGVAMVGLAAFPASAQDIPKVIAPLRVEPDVNGVNLVTGRMAIPSPTLSIPAAPNLKFDGAQNATPYLVGTRTGPAPSGVGATTDNYSIHTGGSSSEAFRCYDNDACTSRTGSGSRFEAVVNQFTQAESGAVYTFNLLQSDFVTGTTITTRTLQYYASSVSYPNGEVISYTYDTYSYVAGGGIAVKNYRPIKLTSSVGYEIAISYQSNTPQTAGWGKPAQATLVATANPATPLARLTYAAPVNGVITITDLAGRAFKCSGCATGVGDDIEAAGGTTTLPTETTAALQAGASSQISFCGSSNGGLMGSVQKDGVNWTYTYTNPRLNGLSSNCIYDGVTVTGPNSFNQSYVIQQNVLGGAGSTSNAAISSVTDSIGRTTSFVFDTAFRPIKMTMPEGNNVNLTYDTYGNIISKIAKAKVGSGLADITETAFVDTNTCQGVRCYRPIEIRDGLNRQTDFVYNTAGQMTEQTDAADATGVRRQSYMEYVVTNGLSRRTVSRVCGLGTTCGTSGEFRTEYSYWNNTFLPSRERRMEPSTGKVLTTDFSYDGAGRLLIKDGPLPGTGDAEYYRYDVIGRRTWEISAANASGARVVKRTTYRAADDKVTIVETGSVTNSAATTFTVTSRVDMSYDSRRNAVRERLSSGGTNYAVTDRTFDDRGRPTCETARLNFAALPAVGSSACTLGVAGTSGSDRVTQKTYDAASQLLKITKALSTPEQADDATYTYSINGKPLSLKDGNGNLMTMAFDGFDRQTRWTFPSPTTVGQVNAADYEAYDYDAAGNRTSFRKRDGSTLTYTYDNLNRVLVKTVPARAGLSATHSRSVYYGYDIRGLQAYARFDSTGGEGIAMAYDGFGRLTSTTTTMDGVTRTLSNTFDNASNRNELTWMDGAKTSFAYDPANRMTALYEGALGSTIAMDSFGYDGLGRKTSQTGRYAQASSFGYDAVSRLASLGHDLTGTAQDVSWTFTYNPASQIANLGRNNDTYAWDGHYNVNRPYAVNGLNQYTTAGSAAFGYDANGNLTSDGSTTFTYDIENRLVSASGAKTAGLRYDPLGRLYETTGASGTTRFLYDGDELVAEFNGTGTLLRRYIHGTSVDDPVVWYEGASIGPARWLHTDWQGSVVGVTDSTGTSIATNRYDEYGIPAAINVGRFQYTGQAWIPELGMYYYKARIYSPTLGRFMQTDPIGYKDQINLYAYVGNDPTNKTDPSGMCPQCGSAVVGAISGAALDYGVQVFSNLAEGKSLGDSLTQVDGKSIAISAVAGAVAGATGVGTGALVNKALAAERAAIRAANAIGRARDVASGTGRAMRLAQQARRAAQEAVNTKSSVRRALAAAAAIKAGQLAAKRVESTAERKQ